MTILQRFVCALLIIRSVCCILAAHEPSEFIKKQPSEDKNSSGVSHLKSNYSTYDHRKSLDKQSRTATHRLEFESGDNSSCCGSRKGSYLSKRPDWYYDRVPFQGSGYSTTFGDRLPTNRYGWHTQGQSSGFSGSSETPGSGSYTETAFYEGSRAGYRPSYSVENTRKPGSYDSSANGGYGYPVGGHGTYHGFIRPIGHGGSAVGGGYGISGTLADGDEFGHVNPNYPEGNVPSRTKIQAQKAVALKALAGVALLGAAAALATNPILLPLGVVSGRRKRSNLPTEEKNVYTDYITTILKNSANESHSDEDKLFQSSTSLSPACIARLACEIQKNHWPNLRKDRDFLKQNLTLQRLLINLIPINVLKDELANMRIKKLIKAASAVSSKEGNCNTFPCTFTRIREASYPSILKL